MKILRVVVKTLAMRMLKWCDRSNDCDNVFNSIRINALVSELVRNGVINENTYEHEVKTNIYKLLEVN